MTLYRGMVHGKQIDAEPELAHRARHEILNGVFSASR
jgi:hypothetical protein